MLIAQISDSHMLPPGEIAYGRSDTEAALRAAVAAVNTARADVVIHTGDFAHHGAHRSRICFGARGSAGFGCAALRHSRQSR